MQHNMCRIRPCQNTVTLSSTHLSPSFVFPPSCVFSLSVLFTVALVSLTGYVVTWVFTYSCRWNTVSAVWCTLLKICADPDSQGRRQSGISLFNFLWAVLLLQACPHLPVWEGWQVWLDCGRPGHWRQSGSHTRHSLIHPWHHLQCKLEICMVILQLFTARTGQYAGLQREEYAAQSALFMVTSFSFSATQCLLWAVHVHWSLNFFRVHTAGICRHHGLIRAMSCCKACW